MATPTLSKEDFLKLIPKPTVEKGELKGIGTVSVRQITVGERDRLEQSLQGKDLTDIRARILISCLVDDEGNSIFDYGDINIINSFPAYVIEPVINVATKLNAISASDIEELKKK